MQTAQSSTLAPAEQRCAWCGRGLAAGAEPLAGRLRCAGCGVHTTHPWPSPDELEAAYAGWYRPDSGRFSGLGDAILRHSRSRLAARLDELAPPGPVLDVGAGDGALLDALNARGREATGLERHSSRPDMRELEIEDVEGTFSAIVFWHSLEHLPRPRAALASAARLLAKGGVLVVAVPNADSLQAHAFGDRWFALDLPRHLVHLPAPALRRGLAELGLQVTRESHLRGGQVVFGWLHGMVGALPGELDLYDAIRRPDARRRELPAVRRAGVLGAAAALFPVAVAAAGLEVALRRGGSVYLEARHA